MKKAKYQIKPQSLAIKGINGTSKIKNNIGKFVPSSLQVRIPMNPIIAQIIIIRIKQIILHRTFLDAFHGI